MNQLLACETLQTPNIEDKLLIFQNFENGLILEQIC